MKKLISSLMAVAMLVCAVAAGAAVAEGDVVYGTMQIPYAAFYAGEGVTHEVDAVSSATDSKWNNEDLTGGSYKEAHTEDAGGDILGVIYPVAISQADLDALGEDNYGFTALEEVPAAYKQVTVTDGAASFSAIQGESEALEGEAVLSTNTAWGDYLVDAMLDSDESLADRGTIYGVLVKTSDGSVYGLRHLENIWRGEIAWSTGITTSEPHGNTLQYEGYVDMMGKTISEIDYITENGYLTLAADLYVPVKFEGGVEVADAPVADGSAAVTLNNLPEDYAPAYEVAGLEVEVVDGTMKFESAMPGSYRLTVSDSNGKYADLLTDFVLSTDELPVTFDAESGALVAAEGADAELAQAFIDNLSAVTVNGTEYAASGRGSVTIIDENGAVDAAAEIQQGRGEEATSTPIFAESGNYEITAASTGFDQTISFTVSIEK